jgi:hypothetical protein
VSKADEYLLSDVEEVQRYMTIPEDNPLPNYAGALRKACEQLARYQGCPEGETPCSHHAHCKITQTACWEAYFLKQASKTDKG